jgi:hypothetical protein
VIPLVSQHPSGGKGFDDCPSQRETLWFMVSPGD